MIFFIKFLLILFLFVFIGLHFVFGINSLYHYLYKYRYYIGFAVIIFVIAFELNNSSIAIWEKYDIVTSQKQSNIIFGKARNFRSDEYAIYTLMLLSQAPDYPYFNKSFRGTDTDMFMIYGQPVKNIVTIFRPFLLGFLFLGSAKGLSFFWIVRLVFLFLITFEFLMFITRRNKKLSIVGTLLVTFAPVVQWWWTPNGLPEMIIYGELAILLLHNYFIQESFVKRTIILFLLTILSGSYILILYPAWQIPFAYIFVTVFIGIFLENHKDYKFYKKDCLPISILIILFIFAFAYIYSQSKETIDIITHTAYPGARCETGGGFIKHIFQCWGNLFFALQTRLPEELMTNVCEMSCVFDFFPLGILLSLIVLFKDKNKDKLLIVLLILDLFFALFLFVGFSEFLAKVTLLKVSPARRLFVAFTFLNLLILVRALSTVKYNMEKFYSFWISFFLTGLVVDLNIILYERYLSVFRICIIAVLNFVLSFMILRNRINKFFVFVIAVMMFVCGAFANPLYKGISSVTDMDVLKAAEKINNEDKGLWIVDELNNFTLNLLPVKGIAVFNSTNTYPNFESLRKLDKERKYENIYNRYSHILVYITEDDFENEKKFSFIANDLYRVNVTFDDLFELKVKYVLSTRSLDDYNDNNKIIFKRFYRQDAKNGRTFYIYKLIYRECL